MPDSLLCVLCREHPRVELHGLCFWCLDCRVLGDPRPVVTVDTGGRL